MRNPNCIEGWKGCNCLAPRDDTVNHKPWWKHMTRAFWIIGFVAAFIVVVVIVGCTGITDTPPQDPPITCKDSVWSDSLKAWTWITVPCGTTANNALGARGME